MSQIQSRQCSHLPTNPTSDSLKIICLTYISCHNSINSPHKCNQCLCFQPPPVASDSHILLPEGPWKRSHSVRRWSKPGTCISSPKSVGHPYVMGQKYILSYFCHSTFSLQVSRWLLHLSTAGTKVLRWGPRRRSLQADFGYGEKCTWDRGCVARLTGERWI